MKLNERATGSGFNLGPTERRCVPIFLALLFFLTSFSEFALVGILDIVAEDLGMSVSAVGQFLTAFSLAGAIGVPIAFALGGRMSRRHMTLISLLLVAISSCATVFVDSYTGIMISRIVLAISSGVFSVTAFVTASHLAPKGKTMSAISTLMIGYNLAILLGLPLGRLMAHHLNWRVSFALFGILTLLVIPYALRITPEEAGGTTPSLLKQLRLLGRRPVLFTLAINLFWKGGYATIYSYITPFIQERTGSPEKVLSAILLGFGIATMVGTKFGGALADKLGMRTTLISVLALHICALVALLIPSGQVMTLTLLVVWGFIAWTPSAVIQQAAIIAAPDAVNMSLSLKNTATQLAYALGGALGGLILQAGASTHLLLAGIGMMGVALALAFALRVGSNKTESLVAQPA
ncbi:MAG: MFS transporter [Corynebacterium sp.]|nr:MFS transporter [Corynebacterium sp.]